MKKEEIKIVYVEWEDHGTNYPNWTPIEDVESQAPLVCHTAGFLLSETQEIITVVQNLALLDSDEEQFCQTMTILKNCIKSIKYCYIKEESSLGNIVECGLLNASHSCGEDENAFFGTHFAHSANYKNENN